MSIVDCFDQNGSNIVQAGANMERENVSSQADGSNQSFSTAANYKSGSLAVYWNGIRQQTGVTITETGSGTFSTSFVASSGDYIFVDYQLDS